MLALVLLIVCCLGTFSLYRYLEIERANSIMWQRALLVAQDQVAVLRLVNTETGCNGKKAEFSAIETCLISATVNSPYTTTMSVKKNVTDQATGETFVKFIDVNVAWVDRRKQSQKLTLQFAVSKKMNLLR
ncbi:MAG: hypothetical protein ACRCWB_09985 [Enterovibrio sp.]